ncbi:uncharacterized protein LOC121967933 [Zingiber officinale]|uniref:uncharacterized protein LOC121967933 n=1 Tax=Zingiber officinale TaxID=94328 RepID=UPI001C4C367C|nr:uncharacterized protein LOC121967933 [Zingiber officinale]
MVPKVSVIISSSSGVLRTTPSGCDIITMDLMYINCSMLLISLAQMESLNVKLYEKYKNLKKRKFTEEEEWNHTRDAELRSFQSAVEDLIEELNKENKGLHQQLDSFQEKYDECRMLLLEEGKKSKELSDEVEKLKNLLLKKKDMNNTLLFTSPSTNSKVRSEEISKSPPGQRITEPCEENGTQHKVSTIVTYNNKKTGTSMLYHPGVEMNTNNVMALTMYELVCRKHLIVEPAYGDCCLLKLDPTVFELVLPRHLMIELGKQSDDRSNFIFQTLMRFLVGMDFYVDNQTESPSILVVHKTSGYSFSLTWIQHEGDEGEWMYHVSSLGTLESIAWDWMKEDIIFSAVMCRDFFERVSLIIGRM